MLPRLLLHVALDLTIYGVKVRSYELRELRDRVRVDSTMARFA